MVIHGHAHSRTVPLITPVLTAENFEVPWFFAKAIADDHGHSPSTEVVTPAVRRQLIVATLMFTADMPTVMTTVVYVDTAADYEPQPLLPSTGQRGRNLARY